MNSFHIRIINLDKTIFDGNAVHCRVRTEIGALGLKARHAPFLAALEPDSSIEVREEDGHLQQFTATEGLLSFKENRCLILLG